MGTYRSSGVSVNVQIMDSVLDFTYACLKGMSRGSDMFPDGASYRSACVLAKDALAAGKLPREMQFRYDLDDRQTLAVEAALRIAIERSSAVIH